MANLLDIVPKDSTDRSVTIRIIDNSDGTPETGVVYNTSGIDLWYRREGAAKTSITEATLASLTTSHSDGGFLHIGDGEYRLDLPDAALATGANYVDIGGTVTGMVVIGGRVRLVDFDLEDAVRGGLTALPNAAADAAGGLPISDAGGLDLDAKLANTNEVTTARMGALTDWINGGRLDSLLDAIKAVTDVIPDSGAMTSIAQESTVDALNDLDAAGIRAAVGLTSADLDTQLGDIVADTNELQTDWADGGRLDLLLDAVNTTTPLDADGIRSAIGMATNNLDTQLTAIVGDTNELQGDWADGGRLDLLLDAVNTTTPPTATAIADAVLIRGVSNVEDSTDEYSLGAMILTGYFGTFSVENNQLVVTKTDASTAFKTYTITTDTSGVVVTGISGAAV